MGVHILQNYKKKNETGFWHCDLFQSPSYILYSASGSFFIPFFITVGFYVRIFGVLRQRMARSHGARSSRSKALSSASEAATGVADTGAGRRALPEVTPLCRTGGVSEYGCLDLPEPGGQYHEMLPDRAEMETSSNGKPGVTKGLKANARLWQVRLFGGRGGSRPVTEVVLDDRYQQGFTSVPLGSSLDMDDDEDVPLRDVNGVPTDEVIILSDDVMSKVTTELNGCESSTTSPPNDVITPSLRVSTDSQRIVLRYSRQFSSAASPASTASPRRAHPRPRRIKSVGGEMSVEGAATPERHRRFNKNSSVVNLFRNIGSIRSLRETWSSHQQNFEQVSFFLNR